MSACMRSLYSSDQCAPGFELALLCGCGGGGVLFSLSGFRAPTLSLSVTRDDGGLDDEFELFMQCWAPVSIWLHCLYWLAPVVLARIEHRRCCYVPLVRLDAKMRSYHEAYCTQCHVENTERWAGPIVQAYARGGAGVDVGRTPQGGRSMRGDYAGCAGPL
jgi:hypothetical protein